MRIHWFAWDRRYPATSDTPHLAIARHLSRLLRRFAFLSGSRPLGRRPARAARAAAVILWLTREDEALAWQVPAQRKALAAAGIPALILPATNWLADDDTLQQITKFCRETFR